MLSLLLIGAVATSSFERPAQASESAPASFEDLLASMGSGHGFEAHFEEEKHLALLVAPLRSRGTLLFDPPSTLLRRVEAPQSQDILVTKTHVRISDASGERILDLSGLEAVRPLIESLIWIFTGDHASLEAAYETDFRLLDRGGSDPARWQVRLSPRKPPLSDLVRELRVSGSGVMADTMELMEVGGDRTLTRITAAKPRTHWNESEQRALTDSPLP